MPKSNLISECIQEKKIVARNLCLVWACSGVSAGELVARETVGGLCVIEFL